MEEDPILTSLAEACQITPQDPAARARLVNHCKEEGTPVSAQLLESLANLARIEEGREEILEAGLLGIIMARGTKLGGEQLLTQACRLGGNLCYDSQLGRSTVQQTGLLEAVGFSLTSANVPSKSKLWQVLPAFLHNYCADSPTSLASVTPIMEIAASHYIELEEEDESVEAWTSLLVGLTDHEGKVFLFTRPSILSSILHLVKVIKEEETLQTILELLQELCEDETISCECLKLDLVPALLSKIDSGIEGEVEMCSLDLLALLSSHPVAIEMLLNPSSPLPSLLPTWLSSDKTHRAATAALIYGNYSTSDSHCSLLVSTTVPPTLVTLLHPDSPVKLLHAVVGCLRNLAVCQAARELLCTLFLPQACVQILLHLAATSDHTVTPKLVATLRLVTQGGRQICTELGNNMELLNCLVSISQFSLVPALAIETARLMASLIRYSEDSNTMANCLQVEGSIPLLISLLNSPHPQLINEVLVVLTIAAATKPPLPSLKQHLDFPFLAASLATTLTNPSCPPQIKSNALQLVHSLLLWEDSAVQTAFTHTQGLREAVMAFDSSSSLGQAVLALL